MVEVHAFSPSALRFPLSVSCLLLLVLAVCLPVSGSFVTSVSMWLFWSTQYQRMVPHTDGFAPVSAYSWRKQLLCRTGSLWCG